MMSLASIKTPSEKPEVCSQYLCQSEQLSQQLQEQENNFELREEALKKECEERMEKEIINLKERFDLILQNEEVRSSWLLREAHRGREEKTSALKTQLECKNLAALMYLLCAERRKNRMETKQIVEEFTNHINTMTEIIIEGQKIMQEMLRGYRTAATVDAEWRTKTQGIIHEFQLFLEHYFGSKPESSKFFFNLPELLRVCAPLDPDSVVEQATSTISCGPTCACDEEAATPEDDTWLSRLGGPDKPFVVYGDMADFSPTQRRQLLKDIKEDKEPPPDKWAQYAFNNNFILSNCPNVDLIRQKYFKSPPADEQRRLQSQSVQDGDRLATEDRQWWKDGSLDIGHGPLASIMRMVTQALKFPQAVGNKASLLGAKDSLELISTTKLLEKRENKKKVDTSDDAKLSFVSEEIYPISLRSANFRKKRASMAPGVESRSIENYYRNDRSSLEVEQPESSNVSVRDDVSGQIAVSVSEFSKLASIHQDSLQFVGSHSPTRSEADRVVSEKECPVTACQRKYANDYLCNLPPYMDFRSPYWEYERTFENYERCTTEQLEKVVRLKQTFERSGKSEKEEEESQKIKAAGQEIAASSTDGASVAVQTSDVSMCLCHILTPCMIPTCSTLILEDASTVPTKTTRDHITSSLLYDDTIQFDRFEVIGENPEQARGQDDFALDRVENIMKIMKKHPSMYSMFQATTKC